MVLRILGRREFLRFVSFAGFDGVAIRANRRSWFFVELVIVGRRKEKETEFATAIGGLVCEAQAILLFRTVQV